MKTYIFTKEVRKWGVEAGDYYNPDIHLIQGGADKLLKAGIIEEELPFINCNFCGKDTGWTPNDFEAEKDLTDVYCSEECRYECETGKNGEEY